jgi:DNA-binding LacI/PurR family transcriptional regulator
VGNNVTMQAIAKAAGVSIATVSRAIHSPHLLHPDTRNRILRVMADNHYVYNAAAADLRKKSSVIGVIIPTAKSSIFGASTLGIQEKAQENGFSIIIGNTRYDDETERRLLMQFEERRVAGVILTGFVTGHQAIVRDLIQRGIPCVLIWETLEDDLISFVGFDNFRASFAMTEYLIGLHHRRIGLIIGPYSKVGRVRKRLEGHRAALERHGIAFDPSLVVEKEPTLIDGREGMQRLLSLPEKPTAVFAASDVLAIGAIAAARERGIRVPDDVSVAGFDDIDFAAFSHPSLTTIRVPAYEIGRLAVKVLLELMNNDPTHSRQYCLDTDLIIRASCREHRGI